MSLIILRAAQREIDEAAAWYESVDPGRGRLFAEAVNRAVQFAVKFPRAPNPIVLPRGSRDFRKVIMKRYPYNVFYEVRGNDIRFIAVSHHKRRPFYWANRLQS